MAPMSSLLVSLVVAMMLAGPATCTFFQLPIYQRQTTAPLPITATPQYDPRTKDWASVASACLAAGNHEKRLFNFFTRASFHDALAVPTVPCGTCAGGADASLLLTAAELARPENVNDRFALNAARVVKRIAAFYGTSAADTLAVCGLVSTYGLTKGQFDIFKYTNLRVGRIDSYTPSTPGQLPPGDVGRKPFNDFWVQRGFTLEEGIALVQGSHALVDEQRCFVGMQNGQEVFCDPSWGRDCSNVRMFQFDNHAFIEMCTPGYPTPSDSVVPDVQVKGVFGPKFDAMVKEDLCKWTSSQQKSSAFNRLLGQQAGWIAPDSVNQGDGVNWPNFNQCPAGTPYPMSNNCPHASRWGFTVMDAKMGQACQMSSPSDPIDQKIKAAMLRYAQNKEAWQRDYAFAYTHMVSAFAQWAPVDPFYITGKECFKGWKSRMRTSQQCFDSCKNGPNFCPSDCVCATGFYPDQYGNVQAESRPINIVGGIIKGILGGILGGLLRLG